MLQLVELQRLIDEFEQAKEAGINGETRRLLACLVPALPPMIARVVVELIEEEGME